MARTGTMDQRTATHMSKSDRRFIFLLNRAQRHVNRLLEQQVQADTNVTATQAGVLFFLSKNDGSVSSAVAKAVGIAAPAMSGLADRMEQKGFVLRRADAEDARATRLFITPLGKELAKASLGHVRPMNQKLCEGFSEEELEVVKRWLTHAADIKASMVRRKG